MTMYCCETMMHKNNNNGCHVTIQPWSLCLFTLATRQCSPQLQTALYYNHIIPSCLTPLHWPSYLSTFRGWWTHHPSSPTIIWHLGFIQISYLSTWCSILTNQKTILTPTWNACFIYFNQAISVLFYYHNPLWSRHRIAAHCPRQYRLSACEWGQFYFISWQLFQYVVNHSSSLHLFLGSIFITYCKGQKKTRISLICCLVGHSLACPPPGMLSKTSLLSMFWYMMWMTNVEIKFSESSWQSSVLLTAKLPALLHTQMCDGFSW